MTPNPNSPSSNADNNRPEFFSTPEGTAQPGSTSSKPKGLGNSAISATSSTPFSANETGMMRVPFSQSYTPSGTPSGQPQSGTLNRLQAPIVTIVLLAVVLMTIGLVLGNLWLAIAGTIVALLISLPIVWVALQKALIEYMSAQERLILVGVIGLTAAVIGLLRLTGWWRDISRWYGQLNWEAVGATGEVFGALGQILIAVLAVYIAWRQYIISRDLTIQQNLLTVQQNKITQQQTIDAYFQGVSDLVLDDEGLLEDYPQERVIAEARTAAILSSVDASGKAKILRFLSRSRLLTPLARDRRLGRAILDGAGGYAEDRNYGIRVIDLGVMLAGADLSQSDLRWTDLSDINLIRANLSRCDLVKTNLARTILCGATLAGSDIMGARFFYGSVKTATPRSRADIPDYKTGIFTGAVVEGADFTEVHRLSDEQRYYCCAWGGDATRATIPGGCDGIPNLLEDKPQ